jgi:DNA-binding SARP family transcriptional activator
MTPQQQPGRPSSTDILIGRTTDLAVLRRVIAGVRQGRSRALVVRGEAGMGKTALLAQQVAEADGLLVLRVRGIESESHLAYAGLFDLCMPIVDHLDDLSPHHTASLRSALALSAPIGHDSFAVSAALLDLFATVSRETPILASIDDGQWLDPSSAEAIAFVARRLLDERIGIVIAVRTENASRDLFDGIDSIVLDGVSDDDAAHILTLSAGDPVARPVSDRLVAAAHGNPLALIELATQLDSNQLSGRAPLPDQLPVGDRLPSVFDMQLTRLPRESVRLLGIAALWEGTLSDLREAPQLGITMSALDPALDAALVSVSEDKVVFRHPLERSSVVSMLTRPVARTVHRALAELAGGNRQRRSHHLAEAADGPDQAVSDALSEAAAEAAGLGALVASTDLYERAAEFATDPAIAADLLARAANAAAEGGSALKAFQLAMQASAKATDPVAVARLLHLRGKLALFGAIPIPEGRRLLGQALEQAEAVDADLAVRISLDATMQAVTIGDRANARILAERGREIAAGEPTTPSMIRIATLARWGAQAFDGEPVDELDVMGASEQLTVEHPVFADVMTATEIAMNGLLAQEYYRSARTTGERFVSAARKRGAVGSIPLVLALTAKASLYLDDWDAALSLGSEALALAGETDQVFAANYASAWLGVLAALRGDRARVDHAASEIARNTVAVGNSITGNAIVSHTLGVMALGEGNAVEAAAHLDDVARFRLAQGALSDGLLRWEGDFAEALIRTGRGDEAEEQIVRLEERSRYSVSPWAGIVAARSRALLASDDDLDGAFLRATTATGGGDSEFERFRTEWCWGERLVAAGRSADAIAHLRVAATGFAGRGATTWALTARRLLEASEAGDGEPAPARITDSDDDASCHDESPDVPRSGPRTITTLGDLVVRVDGREIRPTGHVGRMIAIVATRGSVVHVDELVDALWPDADTGVGRARLRNILSRIRRLTDSILCRDGDLVRLADGVEVDAIIFEGLAARALRQVAGDDGSAPDTARAALARYGGELVPTNRYDDWLVAPREQLKRFHVAMIELLAVDAQSRGDIDEMVAYFERAIASDPYDEAHYFRAARALAELQRRGPALRLIERAARMVDDLGLAPDPKLVALHRRLAASD